LENHEDHPNESPENKTKQDPRIFLIKKIYGTIDGPFLRKGAESGEKGDKGKKEKVRYNMGFQYHPFLPPLFAGALPMTQTPRRLSSIIGLPCGNLPNYH